jgi:hypothetical protein
MPKYIIKIKDRYFEYSSVVDAPVTHGMSLGEFTEYYKEEYGKSSIENLKQRLERVEAKGTSCMLDESVEATISGNVAGKNGKSLTADEIYEKY